MGQVKPLNENSLSTWSPGCTLKTWDMNDPKEKHGLHMVTLYYLTVPDLYKIGMHLSQILHNHKEIKRLTA